MHVFFELLEILEGFGVIQYLFGAIGMLRDLINIGGNISNERGKDLQLGRRLTRLEYSRW